MRESALAALSLVKSRADLLGISADTLSHSDIHIHVPRARRRRTARARASRCSSRSPRS
jgi:hypothetical protein